MGGGGVLLEWGYAGLLCGGAVTGWGLGLVEVVVVCAGGGGGVLDHVVNWRE